MNSSSVEGCVRLEGVRKRRGDESGAKDALREALASWKFVPHYWRRVELGWWLRAQWARLFG